MAFEGLRRLAGKVQEMRATSSIRAEVKPGQEVQEQLAQSDLRTKVADRLRGALRQPVELTQEQLDSARALAGNQIEGNGLIVGAKQRVEVHDQAEQQASQSAEQLANQGDVPGLIVLLMQGKLNFDTLSSEALELLTNVDGSGQVDAGQVMSTMLTAAKDRAIAEKGLRESRGNLPRVSPEAERTRIEASETAQAEMFAFGLRVIDTVAEFGSKDNTRARVEAERDVVTAANVLLKSAGPDVVAMRQAESRYVQQLTQIARLQANRDQSTEDDQARLDAILTQHNTPRVEIKAKLEGLQPNPQDGQRFINAAMERELPQLIDGAYSQLPQQRQKNVWQSFGVRLAEQTGEEIQFVPEQGTVAETLSSAFAELQALSQIRTEVEATCQEHPQAADALYLVALREAKVAQVIVTQTIKLRSQLKVEVMREKYQADADEAKLKKDMRKAQKAQEKAERYGRLRKSIGERVKGGLNWVKSKITAAEGYVTEKVEGLEEESESRVNQERESLGDRLKEMLEKFDRGELSREQVESAVQLLGYRSVEDVRREFED